MQNIELNYIDLVVISSCYKLEVVVISSSRVLRVLQPQLLSALFAISVVSDFHI